MPFTGDSSDDSSDGEEHSVMMTCTASNHNSHNSSSTEHTETSTSNSASSPTKSLKTSSSLSPAKRNNGPESPKKRGTFRISLRHQHFVCRYNSAFGSVRRLWFLHSLNVCDHNFLSALNMIFRFSSHHSLDFIRSCRAYSVHFVIVCVLFVCLFIFSIFYLE